mgnify:CR=1 FL=1
MAVIVDKNCAVDILEYINNKRLRDIIDDLQEMYPNYIDQRVTIIETVCLLLKNRVLLIGG